MKCGWFGKAKAIESNNNQGTAMETKCVNSWTHMNSLKFW